MHTPPVPSKMAFNLHATPENLFGVSPGTMNEAVLFCLVKKARLFIRMLLGKKSKTRSDGFIIMGIDPK